MQHLSRFWQRWQGWLKIGGTAILLVYLLNTVPLANMWQQLRQLSPAALASSFLIFTLSNALFATAWAVALHILGFDLPIQTVGKLFFQSLFINNFASFIGGDSLRVYQVGRLSRRILDATLSVLISRIVMLYAILLLAGVMTWSLANEVGWDNQAQDLGAGLTLFLLLAIPLLSFLNKKPATVLKPQNKTSWIAHFIEKFVAVRQKLQGHTFALLLVLLLSILAQLMSAWAVWVLAVAMAMPVGWWQLLLFLSVIGIALILPISFNGIGIREVGLVGLLTGIQIDSSQALALSLTTSLLVIVTSLIGGISLLIDFLQTHRQTQNQGLP
ncbi:MAG: flippase-like domain-containing protein [Anaerolineaceae bacterium]|nr:flippase-like domain-containing protein [Anaerolineaceae bacterium]